MDTYRLFFKSMLNIVGKYYIYKGKKAPGNEKAGATITTLSQTERVTTSVSREGYGRRISRPESNGHR